MKLQHDDLTSATWMRVRQLLEERRATLLGELTRDLPHETTAKLRGRIAEVNELLALKAPAQAADPFNASVMGPTGPFDAT